MVPQELKFVLFFLGMMIAASMVSEQAAIILACIIFLSMTIMNADRIKELIGKVWV